MRKYWIIVRQSFINQLAYGSGSLVWFGVALLELIIPMTIWLTASSVSGTFSGYTKSDILTYYILIGIIGNLSFWWTHFDIEGMVRSGELSSLLIKPYSALGHIIFTQFGDKTLSILIRLPIFVLVFSYFHISLHISFVAILAIILAILMYLLISLLFGTLSFWITDTGGFVGLFYFSAYLFSGELAPLAFYPPWFTALTSYLPYRYILSFPIEIIMDNVNSTQIFIGFLIGIGWLAILYSVLKVTWKKSLREYQAYGN